MKTLGELMQVSTVSFEESSQGKKYYRGVLVEANQHAYTLHTQDENSVSSGDQDGYSGTG